MTNTAIALRPTNDNSTSRNEVIERSLPLVKSIAARLRQAHGLSASFDDLYALGVDGLLQAADRFDPARGVAFTTFAYYRIRGAILDSFRRGPQRAPLVAPRAAASARPSAGALIEAANDNGRADDRSAAHADRITWLFAESAAVHLESLDELGALADESALHPDEEIERHRVAERVAAALSSLPETERKVVELHYYEELSFSEIGAKLGICKPWAFRLHNKALKQLKEKLAELSDTDDADGNA
jgi:RNA polymerase sigma factor for flagellar operon FliA